MQNTKENISILIKTIGLAFLPTILTTGAYWLVGSQKWGQEVPALLLFFICAIIFLIPVELGIIGKASKEKYGKQGFRIVVEEQERLPWWQILLYGVCLFGLAGILSVTVLTWEGQWTSGWNGALLSGIYNYFDWTNMDVLHQYPRYLVILTCVIYIILNGFVAPIVEELFFRGYLTGRLKKAGKAAPAIVTILFSLYHFWLPFQNLFRISIFLPVSYIVWKKKNIYIGMTFHCMCNVFSCIGFINAALFML